MKIDCIQKMSHMRQELQSIGMKYGFTHHKTIQLSEQLDGMIIQCTKKQIESSRPSHNRSS